MFQKTHLKKLAIMVIILLMAGLLFGCSGGDGNDESSITILIPENPVAFNGLVTDNGYSQALGELIMLSVSEADPYGNIYGELATEIPTVENGGVIFDEDTWSMTVTWTLRQDVFWSDGEQVTADDVIFTANKIAEDAWQPWVDYVETIEKIDDFTFTIYFWEGYIYPDYALMFGGEDFFVYPEHYCDGEQNFQEWDCETNPLSSGPYILDEYVSNDHLTFIANPDYFAGEPEIKTIHVQIVPEESVKKVMMLGGEGDLHYWPAENASEEYKIEGNLAEYVKSPTERWTMYLIPNLMTRGDRDTPHPFLSDVNVRRALRMSIDVDTILETTFLGYGVPQWTDLFRSPWDGCEIPRPEFNPTAAAVLLEEAGWTDSDGDGVRECNGCLTAEEGYVMNMEFAIYAEYGESLELAQQLIAENWLDIGLSTDLEIIEGAIMWASAEEGGLEETGEFEMDMWDDGYPGLDPSDYLWTYYYSESEWNYGMYANEDADYYIDELYTLYDEDRLWAGCELAKVLDEDVPWINLFSTLEQHGVSTRLNGVLPSANDSVTWNAAEWTIGD